MDIRERHGGRVVVHSSYALLQERFREVQRVKAMREERENILRMQALSHQPAEQYLMNSNHPIPTINMHCHYTPETARLFFHPHHSDHGSASSASKVSLSQLWPTILQSKHHEDENEDCIYRRSIETPLLINIWPTITVRDSAPWSNITCSSSKFQDWDTTSDCDSDVDTSLHL